MNKEEFGNITSEVIADLLEEFDREGASSNVALATVLTLTVYTHKLADRLFSNSNEITIVPDKEA